MIDKNENWEYKNGTCIVLHCVVIVPDQLVLKQKLSFVDVNL